MLLKKFIKSIFLKNYLFKYRFFEYKISFINTRINQILYDKYNININNF